MELKIFNKKENNRRVTRPGIWVSIKGAITINPIAVSILGISEGDYIEFSQDKANPLDFYMRKSESNSPGATILRKPQGNGSKEKLVCHNSSFSRTLLHVLGKGKSASILTASKPVNEEGWYAILTRSFL